MARVVPIVLLTLTLSLVSSDSLTRDDGYATEFRLLFFLSFLLGNSQVTSLISFT